MRINPSTGELLKGVGRAWLNDSLSVQQVGSDASGWKIIASNGEVLDEQGFNVVAAGGGKWATWLAGRGPKGNFGPLDPAGIVLDIGRDGTVAWCPRYQAGMQVQGSLALSTRVCGPDHIVYALADRRVYSTQLGFAKIPAGVTPFKAYVLDGALLYHTHEHLILQRYHEPIGIVVAEKPAYSPDMIRVPGGWRVVWCLNEGETETRERAISDAELSTDLSGVRDFPIVVNPPTPPKPPANPPKEPVPMTGITDAQFATLQRLRTQYPSPMTPEQIGALLNEWAWIHRAEGCGMQRKDGGTAAVQPTTGVHVWNGVRFTRDGQHFGQDVLSGASIGLANPVRGEVGPADPASFVAPVEPAGTVNVPPADPPKDPPKPPVSSGDFATRADLDAAIADLHTEIGREVATDLEQIRARLSKLEGGGGSTGGADQPEVVTLLQQILALLQKASVRLGVQV